MTDDQDSYPLVIDETDPPDSPEDVQNIIQKNTVTTPVPDNTTELRNFRKFANLPSVNYLSLMENYTLNTIQNNMLNTTEKHRITVKDFARIPDASSNENSDSVLYDLLTENSTNFQAYFDATVPINEALKAEAQNKDPRAEETWVPTSNAADQREPIGHTIHTDPPHVLSVSPIPQNAYASAYEVQNGNIIPHTPSTHMNARQATVILPNSGNLSGGTMTYPPSTQHNGNTIPTAHNSRLVQDGQTQYIDFYNRPHNSPTDASSRMNHQRTQPIIKFRSGYPYSRPSTIPAQTLNHHPCNTRPPPSPYMYTCMRCGIVKDWSANPHMMPANPNNVPSNGYFQYGTNSIPQAPYGRDT